jgi:cobalt-zinc-cadmium efflux system membrane fusion protein
MSQAPEDTLAPPGPTDPVVRPAAARARPWRRRIVVGGVVLGAAIGAGAHLLRSAPAAAPPGSPTPLAASAPPARALPDVPFLDGELIRFSDDFVTRAALTTADAEERELSPRVNVTGTVTWDSRRFAAVGARIPGRVRRVWKVLGDDVRPGDLLAELESAELGRAEAQVLAARAKEIAAEADMKREAALAEARVSSTRDAEFARAAYEAARAERTAAEHTVAALGGEGGGQMGVLRLRAPVAGRIVGASAVRGQTVDATTTLFEIADRGAVWVELSVFERDLETVRPGDKVEITAQSNTRRTLLGKVAVVGEAIDHDTRSAPVRVEVDNQDHQLRPGQSVLARIETSGRASTAIAIPRTAVTRVDGKPTVFVMLDRNTVEPRPIVTGPADSSHVAVLEGLKAGERIVVGGLLALKSEIFR